MLLHDREPGAWCRTLAAELKQIKEAAAAEAEAEIKREEGRRRREVTLCGCCPLTLQALRAGTPEDRQ